MNGVELLGQIPRSGGHGRRGEKKTPRLRPSTPSSVAIHFTPSLWAMASTSSETLPSDGQTPSRPHAENLLRADRARAAVARERPPDGENGSAAKADPGSKLRPRWYRRPAAESGGKTAKSKFRSRPAGPRLGVGRQDLGQKFPLACDHEALVFQGIAVGLFESGPRLSGSSRKNSSNQAICESTCRSVKSCG